MTVYDDVQNDYDRIKQGTFFRDQIKMCSGCVTKCEECCMDDNPDGVDGDYQGSFEAINPNHYRSHPSGIECIQITEHMDFLLGNAVKYIWRAGLKDDRKQDLEKAMWYLQRAINRE